MSIQQLYKFEKGQGVPGWLYLVRDAGAEEDIPCSFGTGGFCGLMGDGAIWVWPTADRSPDEYIFAIKNDFFANASAEHPAGDELLTVLPSEVAARELLGASIDDQPQALPESDPRV